MGLAENVSALATRVATEIKAVRTEIAGKTTTTYVDNAINAYRLEDAADNSGDFKPADHSLLGWTFDPIDSMVAYQPPGNGNMVFSMIKLDAPITCGSVTYGVVGAGATMTANRNYIGLYNISGSLLRQTADQSGNMTAANIFRGGNTWTSGSIALAAGVYYMGLIVTATTRPTFMARSTPSIMGTTNTPSAVGRSSYRFAINTATVYTALPATLPSATAFPAGQVWFGLGA